MNSFVKKLILIIKTYVKDIISDVSAVYIERGFEPFKKPVIYGALSIVISYLIYLSNLSSLKKNKSDLEKLNEVSNFYSEYVDLKSTINSLSMRLPQLKDKDEFLNYVLNTTAAKYQITFSNIETQKEVKFDNLSFVSKRVSFTSSYSALGNFVRDIENYPLFVGISQVTVSKKNDESLNPKLDISITLSTIFMAKL